MKKDNPILTNFKAQLLEVATIEKRDNPKDKARVRQCINDTLDMLIRELDFKLMREMITKFEKIDIENSLINYTIKLHPKN